MKGIVKNKEVNINKGDRVVIEAQGTIVSGRVISVNYYPQIMDEDDYGWQIELSNASVFGGYSHWKQWQDGGFISEINDVKI